MSLSAAEQATINQGSIDAANRANASAGITSAAPAGSSFVDPATNKPVTSSATPLMVTSSASRSQYNDNVNTLNQATGKGMPSATSPGQSTAAQLGNTVGAAPTPAPGTTINIHAPTPTTIAPKTDTVAQTSSANLIAADPSKAGQPGYDTFGAPVAGSSAPSTTGTGASQTSATASGFDLIDPTAKAFLQQNIDNLTSQATQAKAQIDAATATNNNDPAMLAAAKAIKDRYDQLINAMVDHNKIVIGGATVNSARTGGMQYAPDMNALFMNDAMQRATQRVTDLKNEQQDLINKSNEAYKANDVKALNDAITNYNKVSTDRMTAVSALLKAASDAVATQRQKTIDQQNENHQKLQDMIAGANLNLAQDKQTYQQKKDAIDEAYQQQQITELQRHNLQSEAVARETAMKGRYQYEAASGGVFDTQTGKVIDASPTTIFNGTVTPGKTGNPLLDANTQTTPTGVPFIDGTNFTGKQANDMQLAAAKMGIPYLGKAGASAMDNIAAAKNNAAVMATTIDKLNPSDTLNALTLGVSRAATSAVHWLEGATQVGPGATDIGSYNVNREGAIKAIQALAAGGTGVRINQAEIDQMMSNLPTYNDTKSIAADKLKKLNVMFDNNEKAIIGDAAYNKYNPNSEGAKQTSELNALMGTGVAGASPVSPQLNTIANQYGL